jgi:hypothetical protein
MDGDERGGAPLGGEKLSAIGEDANRVGVEHGLSSGGAEANDELGFERAQFGFQPGAAGGNFAGVGFLVQSAFAAQLPLEVLDGVRDVELCTFDAPPPSGRG